MRDRCAARHDIGFDVARILARELEHARRSAEQRVEPLAGRGIGEACPVIGAAKRQDRLQLPPERQGRLGRDLVGPVGDR